MQFKEEKLSEERHHVSKVFSRQIASSVYLLSTPIFNHLYN